MLVTQSFFRRASFQWRAVSRLSRFQSRAAPLLLTRVESWVLGNSRYPALVCSFTGAGATEPISQCPCTPGGTFGVSGEIGSEFDSLSGILTVGGDSIPYSCDTATPCGGGLGLTYAMTLPNVGPVPPSTLILQAPFTATAGFLTGPYSPPGGVFLQMSGQGTATVDLSLLVPGFVLGPGAPSEYIIQSEQFAFSTVPEPGTAALALTAFAAIIALRRYSPIF
jgi:hypothetical protein